MGVEFEMRSPFIFCLLLLSPFESFGQIPTDPPAAPNAAGRLATVAGTVTSCYVQWGFAWSYTQNV